ncbi:hypothetical protein QX201_010376 [Fusarium graminearum]
MPHTGGINIGNMPNFLSNSMNTVNSSYNSKIPSVSTTEIPAPMQTTPQEKTTPSLSQRCMDQARPLKVIYIGGGISGICGAIEFRKQVPDVELVIYEKNPDLGGTWFENR